MARRVKVDRVTKETQIQLGLDMDGGSPSTVGSGIAFFDHLLSAMAFHGGLSVELDASGDLAVDAHHLVEDVGLVLGAALQETVTKHGAVARFGHSVVPMDEALAEVSVDVCGRPTAVLSLAFPQPLVGSFDVALLREFFIALASRAGMSLHVAVRCGENSHHMAEAAFKALGKALGQAYRSARGSTDTMSTKGTITF